MMLQLSALRGLAACCALRGRSAINTPRHCTCTSVPRLAPAYRLARSGTQKYENTSMSCNVGGSDSDSDSDSDSLRTILLVGLLLQLHKKKGHCCASSVGPNGVWIYCKHRGVQRKQDTYAVTARMLYDSEIALCCRSVVYSKKSAYTGA